MDGIKEKIKSIREKIVHNDNFNPNALNEAPPLDVRLFLGRLALLHGVPAHYLLPNEKLLPLYVAEIKDGKPELTEDGLVKRKEIGSLRFFLLDRAWIEYLVDGALSTVERKDRDFLRKKTMGGRYAAEALRQELIERYQKQSEGQNGIAASIIKANEIAAKFNEQSPEGIALIDAAEKFCYSGFLLRSSLNQAWKGVEIEARGTISYSDPEVKPLHVARIERLDQDTLFCLCLGIITSVNITQPPENPHFGFTYMNGNDSWSTTKAGTNETIKIPLRSDGNQQKARRVIRLESLQEESLEDLLEVEKGSGQLSTLLTAHPLKVSFNIKFKTS